MKIKLFRTCMLAACAVLFYGCSPDEEGMADMSRLEKLSKTELTVGCEMVTFDHVTRGQNGFVTEVRSNQSSGSIMVSAYQRTGTNTYSPMNVANIFNSGQTGPVGMEVDDILTPHKDFGGWGVGEGGKRGSSYANDTPLGNMMIINRSADASQAYDHNSGGKMMFDFSSFGTVTMTSVTVLDVDSYEQGTMVILYGPNSTLLKEVLLDVSGSNGKQIVDLGGTKGVERMEIILGPQGAQRLSGSGAVDNIIFCPEPQVYGCTRTQGYWKTHAEGKKYDAAWGTLPNTTFYGSGMTYLQLMKTPPKGGNAYVILAHQYIAAMLNMKNASSPADVDAAFAQATAYFSAMSASSYTNTLSSPYTTVSRETLIMLAEKLAAYNEGKTGPGHCD